MTSTERRAVASMATLISMRLFGAFLILPVFALYAEGLAHTTPFLVGLALGAYGLTQALFQIPYGMASDRFGRKPMIVIGLAVFALGSVVAALATSIYWVIAGRALQGMGAIAAVVIALTADLTREEQRTKAMALIGVTIGFTFLLSLVIGPVLNSIVGVPGIFWFTALLASLGILILTRVPTPVSSRHHLDVQPAPAQFAGVLRDTQLLRLDLGIFLLHMVLTATFVVIPLVLVQETGIAAPQQWKVYLSVIALSVVGMVPLVFLSSRKHLIRYIFIAAVALLLAGQLLMYFEHAVFLWLAFALWLFFVGFNVMEALLPSLVSRVAPAQSKGTAVGVYNSFQYFGVFLGGALGGWVHGAYGFNGVFLMCAALLVLWLAVTLTSPAPRLLDTRLLRVGPRRPDEARALVQQLSAIAGVAEAVVVAEDGVAYLKVDKSLLDDAALERFAAT